MYQEINEAIRRIVTNTINEINTSLPAKITAFNKTNGTATVLPYGKYLSDGKLYNYPHISGVPVIFPYSSKSDVGIVFPVKKGDDCLLIMSQEELDCWMYGTQDEGSLKFDLTNAIAIPGLSKKPSKYLEEACVDDKVVITSKNTKMCISDGSITVCGDFYVEGNISYTGECKQS